jgi:hypothetical protein
MKLGIGRMHSYEYGGVLKEKKVGEHLDLG